MEKMQGRNNLCDVIIIGGGPAGLTASIYTSRMRLKTLLFESPSLSSQIVLTDKIENYPGFPEGITGFELIERFKKQSELFGTKFMLEEINNIGEIEEDERKIYLVTTKQGIVYKTLSIIIASGAMPKKLGAPRENEFCGRGISYCATCDGAFFKNKRILVVGGGDAAIEESLFLTKFGEKVTIIHRRKSLRAAKILQERAFANKKIEFIWNSQIVEFLGEHRIRGVRIKDIETEKETDVSCEGIFIFVGYMPNTNFLKEFIKLDAKNFIVTAENMNTEKKGVFACGDCRKKPMYQIITACGDGATAAFSVQKYLEELNGRFGL